MTEQQTYDVDLNKCVLWTGAKNSRGYGHRQINGRTVYVHRLAYEAANGPIPEGMMVLHRCDVRSCHNPEHLYLGTAKQNTADMLARDRQPAHMRPRDRCSKGHDDWRSSGTDRKCRTCERERGTA